MWRLSFPSIESENGRRFYNRCGMAINVLYMLFQAMSPYSIQEGDRNTVSSFYGLGCFLSWIMTSIHTLLPGEYRALLHRKGNNKAPGFDAGLLAVVAYPTAASFDHLIRFWRHEDSPQREAALCVTRMAAAVAYMAVLTVFYFNHWIRASARRRAVWVFLWNLCTFLSCFPVSSPWFVFPAFLLWVWTLVSTFFMTMSMMGDSCRIPDVNGEAKWSFFAFWFCWIGYTGTTINGLAILTWPTTHPVIFRISVPRTGAGLRELDQWFPLLCTLFLIVWPVCRRLAATGSRGSRYVVIHDQ